MSLLPVLGLRELPLLRIPEEPWLPTRLPGSFVSSSERPMFFPNSTLESLWLLSRLDDDLRSPDWVGLTFLLILSRSRFSIRFLQSQLNSVARCCRVPVSFVVQ